MEPDIRKVAIYLRKSRADEMEADVLSKHRDLLVGHAKRNGWQYMLYEEVMSGASLALRREMLRLLEDVQENKFDAVLVVDIDRLGRTNLKEWGIISESFLDSGTYIVTPERIYDPSDETDETMLDIQSVFAKIEYKMIKKRLQRGKRMGTQKGLWTNGKPPYPYYYDPIKKAIFVDEEKAKIYRLIIDRYLNDGHNMAQISYWLNGQGISSPGNRFWSPVAIDRLLRDEVHVGYVITNKQKGSGHKVKLGKCQRIPEDKWTKVKGQHQPLKTPEEHERISVLTARNRILPDRAKQGVFALSGLLYCKKCNYCMALKPAKITKNRKEQISVALCTHYDPFGNRCQQKGRLVDKYLLDALYEKVIKIDSDKLEELAVQDRAVEEARAQMKAKKSELAKMEKVMVKIHEAFEADAYTTEEFINRKKNHEQKAEAIKAEIIRLEQRAERGVMTPQLLKKVEQFKDDWKRYSRDEEKNRALRSIIDRIWYDRDENGIVYLDIQYL